MSETLVGKNKEWTMRNGEKIAIKDMTPDHRANAIAMLERQIIDPQDVVGDHDEYRWTISQILDQNERIEKRIKELRSYE